MADQTKGHRIVAASIAGLVFSTVAIILRCLTRTVKKNSPFSWDDYLAISAWLFATALNAIMIYWVHVGFGQHMADLARQGVPIAKIMLPVYVQGFLYNTGITLVKLSALYYYHRIFASLRLFNMAVWAVVALALAWWICFTLIVAFQCTPIRKAWDVTVPGHCFQATEAYVATAVLNVIIDFFILLLPMPFVWRLRMKLKKQVVLTMLFIAGYGVMVISILRVVTTVQFEAIGDTDFTWNAVTTELLFILELNIGVFTICLPAIVQLFRKGYKESVASLVRSDGSGRSGSDQSQWSVARGELIGSQTHHLSAGKSDHPGSTSDNTQSEHSLQYPGINHTYSATENIEMQGHLDRSQSSISR